MKAEEYMKHSKRTLAEELERRDAQTYIQIPTMPTTPVAPFMCDGTHCTNPQMDCVNCPRKGIIYTTNITTEKYYGD